MKRCFRCHTILTSEDKHYHGISCHNCECDVEWEEYERDYPIKSAYWRWRAVCFGLRFLRHYPAKLRDLLVHRLRSGPGSFRQDEGGK